MKNSKTRLRPFLQGMLATLIIPLAPSPQWQDYSFNKIPPNQFSFQNGELKISVKKSASPLIYAFEKPLAITSIKLEGQIDGVIKGFPADKTQGHKGQDDFVLRLGLILKGTDRLNWIQRQIAPQWLVDMEKKLPENVGVDRVYYLTTCRQAKLKNVPTEHFLNAKFTQECITLIDGAGALKLQKNWTAPLQVVGLWVGSDGDDLGDQFDLTIKEIQINYSKKSL